MSGSIGAKLRYSNTIDIELLTAIRQDLKSDRDDGFSEGSVFVALFGAEHILSEVLGLPYSWSQNVSQDGGARSGSLPAQASVSDSDDETWVEEWNPEDLYRWILNELRGLQPLDSTPRRLDLRRRLEKRLALSEGIQPSDALPEVLNSSTDRGTDLVKPLQADAVVPCPISFLPVELLQDIFHLVGSSGREIRNPLTLSHVSSHFRSVVLGMPSLWTTIDNLLPIPIVELYTTRSGAEPLRFSMSADRLASIPQLSRNRWLDILFKSSGRIKAMEVYGCNPPACGQWTGFLNDHGTLFRSLVTLELVISEWGQRDYGGPKCPRWEWFPCLQDLWIRGYRSDGWVGFWDPFPPSLRRLKLSKGGKIPIRILSKALRDIPDLRVLSLDHCSVEPPWGPRSVDVITMTNLEELEVTRMSTTDIRVLTSHMHTPNLTSLSVTYLVDRGLNIAEILIPFTRAHPQLRSLQIRECSMAKKECMSILESVTHLNRLVIRASDLQDEDLRGLGLASVPILPNLTHLTLENELRLTTSLVEQVVRTHPDLVSVILRGWDASHISKANVSVISGLVPYVRIQTFGNTKDEFDAGSDGEEDQWDDSYWEGSDFSEDDGWLSGDEAVLAKDG